MANLRKESEKRPNKQSKTSRDQPDSELSEESMAAVLTELRTLRKEHAEASKDTKESLTRVETALSEVADRTTQLEQRMTEYEERLVDSEEKTQRNERALRYLLHREANMAAKCEDLESRARRNNLRIYGVKEDEENNSNMLDFVSDLIRTSLALPGGQDLNIVRAHRSLTMKPKDPKNPPRSIIVRFLDYRVKEMVIQEAWKRRGGVPYNDQKIFFDQDYTADIQKKRKQVRDIIKQLKEKSIKAQSPFPAKLKIHLDSGVKTFATLGDAAETLKDLGIHVDRDERETLLTELLQNNWMDRARRHNMMTNADLKSLLHKD